MENVYSTAPATPRKQQHFQLQPDHQEHENQQQFCLRWHNHQTSLLSTLPVLLDQSHLTDVTISAEGRTLRAHRVVLSACSTFFLELFRTLDPANHPVIILPGASFSAIVALLTFMYSGEVNVYEEQIPVLLSLAETLGVKGLADVQNNKSASKVRSMDSSCDQPRKTSDDVFDVQPHSMPSRLRSPSPSLNSSSVTPTAIFSAPLPQVSASSATTHPFGNPLLAGKFPTQLENFFLKSLQFYPHLLPQPLNFSQTALNKTTELLAKYQKQCNLYQGALNSLAGVTGVGSKEVLAPGGENSTNQQCLATTSPSNKAMPTHEDPIALKRFCPSDKLQPCSTYMQQQQDNYHQQKDTKRIDKIADNLRYSNGGGDVGSRQLTIGDKNSTQHSPMQPQHNLRPTLAVSSLANTAINTSCSFPPIILPQLGTTKPPPIFTTASMSAATTIRNPSPQPQHAVSIASASTATAFETSIEEHVARSLHQQIEQLASCSRLAGSSGGDAGAGDVGMMTPNTKSNDNSTINQQKSSTASVEKFQMESKTASVLALPTSPSANTAQGKTSSNSKLYATCFICHKQLSNQYNLRVHLETHQNVRYSCNVCSHVSRSKDALRKHVSYRHPGAPSPCETEARRKRATRILLGNGNGGTASSMPATSPPMTGVSNAIIGATLDSGSSASSNSSEAQIAAAAAHLNSAAAYMFLPNQFHLAAAAAAVVQQQQVQQLKQEPAQRSLQGFCTSTANSPAELEIDSTLLAATVPAAPIRLEQHSPTSTEGTSRPQTPQLQEQHQQQKPKGSDAATNSSKDLTTAIQRSSPV